MKKEEIVQGREAILPENFHNLEKFNVSKLEDITNFNYTKFVDWTLKDIHKLGPVVDQGKCQACWAFTASETLASALAILQDTSY